MKNSEKYGTIYLNEKEKSVAVNEIDKDLIMTTIMDNSQDTIYVKDKNSAIIWSSKAHALLWGVDDPKQVIGKTDFDYFPYDFAAIAYKEEQNIIRKGIPIVRKVERLVKANGETQWLLSTKYPFYSREGEIVGTWGTSRDITDVRKAEEKLRLLNLELKEANRQLSILSTKDSLSDLYNHRYFSEELERNFDFYTRQVEQGNAKDFSLIMLDIDNFKMVNDTFGHLIGDFTIKRVADIMLENVHESHICFRYGGDEFAVLLLDTAIGEARRVASDLQKMIEKTQVDSKNPQLVITVSMGVADFSHSVDSQDLMRRADDKLYFSKRNGKNIVS